MSALSRDLELTLGGGTPSEVRLRIQRIESEGDPVVWARDWVRRHGIGGGWVQLAGGVLSRRGADPGWARLRGEPAEVEGMVLSAEGMDSEGRSWRLRTGHGGSMVWRAEEGSGEAALRFDRSFECSGPVSRQIRVVEYWALRARPGLQIEGGAGMAWAPHFACFSGWGEQDGR